MTPLHPPPIRLALVGCGNCAAALVQGISYYRDRPDAPGLMTPLIDGFGPGDLEVVAAFDVAAGKVGRDLGAALASAPNNTLRFAPLDPLGVTVSQGPLLDGIGATLEIAVPLAEGAITDVAAILHAAQAEVVINYLPVGSECATAFYARAALAAGCGFLNAIPVFLANDPAWQDNFAGAGLPLAGDDIKSQFGATAIHQALAALAQERGVAVERTYQLNFGGNTDFLNMLDQSRLGSKRRSKTQAVQAVLDPPLPAAAIHIGPSDYVPWLTDRKVAYIRLEGTAFGSAPWSAELRLDVWDSPNSAGVVLDAARHLGSARRAGRGGLLPDLAPYFKAPGSG